MMTRSSEGCRKGFTLIELLVVIAVIGVLAGILFTLMQLAQRKAQKADCISRLERISHALNEYRSDYGTYPPVNFAWYEHESYDPGSQTPWFQNVYIPQTPTFPYHLNDYGMTGHLYPREAALVTWCNSEDWAVLTSPDHTTHWSYIPDIPTDLANKKRWWPFLEGIPYQDVGNTGNLNGNMFGAGQDSPFVQVTYVPIDPWFVVATPGFAMSWIHYRCSAPYTQYQLWSLGPDGQDGSGDDLHKSGWDE